MSETDRPAGEIERAATRAVAPRQGTRQDERPADDQDLDEGPGIDWSRQLTALRQHKITLACGALILAQLIWKAAFIRHYYFHQDDFFVMDAAVKSGLSWHYLTLFDSGHMFPGVYATAWVLVRVALYNWTAASAVVLVLVAGASVAAWWLLRTLLGKRPAILIPLTLYLYSGLAFANFTWWIRPVEALPLQIGLFMALSSHVYYVRTGVFRHAVAAAAWLLFGLAFNEKSVFIPLVLFAVTVGYLAGLRLVSAVAVTVSRYWKGWVLYLCLLAVYGTVFALALHTSGTKTAPPGTAHAVSSFGSRLVFDTLLPGLLGGPWSWYHPLNSVGAYAHPPAGLIWLSAIAVAAVVVASILTRRSTWRAWAILAGWVVLADMLPVAIGRLNLVGYATLFGMETRYVSDVPAVLAIVVALAFWQLSRPGQDAGTAVGGRKEFFTGRWRAVAVVTVAVCVLGSVWSVQRFQILTTRYSSAVTPIQTYFANARAALAQAPAGTVIVSQQVPGTVMESLFGPYARSQVVLGPLVPSGAQIGWTVLPSGQIGQLRVFGPDGRLWPAAIDGSTTVTMPFLRGCLTPKRKTLVLHFPAATWAQNLKDTYVLRLGYVTSPGSAGSNVTVTYGSYIRQFTIKSGESKAYFTVWGAAPDVVLQANLTQGGVCFGPAVAGTVGVFPGSPIPATGS